MTVYRPQGDPFLALSAEQSIKNSSMDVGEPMVATPVSKGELLVIDS